MTYEQKIKKLTGATAAVIDADTKQFGYFTEISIKLAKDLMDGVADGSIKMGVSMLDARLYFHSVEANTIWKLADKKMVSLAK